MAEGLASVYGKWDVGLGIYVSVADEAAVIDYIVYVVRVVCALGLILVSVLTV